MGCKLCKSLKHDKKQYYERFYFKEQADEVDVTPQTSLLCAKSFERLKNCESSYLHAKKQEDRLFSPVTEFYQLFYDFLSRHDEETFAFFSKKAGTMQMRAKSLFAMIKYGIDMPKTATCAFAMKASGMAYWHKINGVRTKYYSSVVEALLHALEITLAEEFTHEVKNAWVQTYSKLLANMLPSALSDREKQDIDEERRNKEENEARIKEIEKELEEINKEKFIRQNKVHPFDDVVPTRMITVLPNKAVT